MAKKASKKESKQDRQSFDEKDLNKGHIRKLTALRKSLGPDIADKAFAAWFAKQSTATTEPEDANAKLIVATLEPLVLSNQLKIPRGGYLVKRGRGRIVIDRPA